MILYETVTAEQTLDLRHRVLWPNHPRDFVRVAGDDTALHMGAMASADIVGVASFFADARGYRLRKLAVDTDWRGQGIARALIDAGLARLPWQDGQVLWCDAREDAMGFYTALGFTIDPTPFLKETIPYRRAQITPDPASTP